MGGGPVFWRKETSLAVVGIRTPDRPSEAVKKKCFELKTEQWVAKLAPNVMGISDPERLRTSIPRLAVGFF
jgi:hypothetical protein